MTDTILKNLIDETALRKQWDSDPKIRLIEACRRELSQDSRMISDLPGGTAIFDNQSVSSAARGSKNYINCLRLCTLAMQFSDRAILELGTNLGISSAYIAAGASKQSSSLLFTTADCSQARIDIARSIHQKCKLPSIEYRVGYFDDTLDSILKSKNEIGFCFIDGDHTYEPTWKYYRLIRQRMVEGGVIAFDDINWSSEMKQVWKEISTSESFHESIEIDGVGYIRVAKSH